MVKIGNNIIHILVHIEEHRRLDSSLASRIPLRSSKIVDFGTNRKRVCDFLSVLNGNLGPILGRFRDIKAFLRRRLLFHTPPLYRPKC